MPHAQILKFISANDMPARPPRPGLSASLLALVALAAWFPADSASADDECGTATTPNQTISCSDGQYPSIIYNDVDGLTLNLSNPAMIVIDGLRLVGSTSSIYAVALNATQFSEIKGPVTVAGQSAVTANIVNGKIDQEFSINSSNGDVTVMFENAILNNNASISTEPDTNLFGKGDIFVTSNGNTNLKKLQIDAEFGDAFVKISGGIINESITINGYNSNNITLLEINEETGPTYVRMAEIVSDTLSTGNIIFKMSSGNIYLKENSHAPGLNSVYLDNSASKNSSYIDAYISGGSIQVVSEYKSSQPQVISMIGTGNQNFIMSAGYLSSTGYDASGVNAVFEENSWAGFNFAMSGGVIEINGTQSISLEEQLFSAAIMVDGGSGHEIRMLGGSISAQNANGIAFINLAANSTQNTTLNAGNLKVSNEFGSAILFGNADFDTSPESPHAEISIGANMTIDASKAAYSIYNGIDMATSDISVTSSGTVQGHIMFGGGTSGFSLSGGTVTGNIYGDYDQVTGRASDTVNQGSDNLIWTAGAFNGTFYGQGGSDSVTIGITDEAAFSAASFDGGENTDTFTFYGATLSGFDGTKITNFEKMALKNSAVTLQSNGGVALRLNGITDTSGRYSWGEITIDSGSSFSIGPGNLARVTTIQAGVAIKTGGTLVIGPSNQVNFVGSIENSGTIRFSGSNDNNILSSNGNYNGASGALVVTVDFSQSGRNDALAIAGSVQGVTEVTVNPLFSPGAPHIYNLVAVDPGRPVDPNAFQLKDGKLIFPAFVYTLQYSPHEFVSGATHLVPGFILAPTTSEHIANFLDEDFILRASTRELVAAGLTLQPYVPLYEAYQSVLLEMMRLPSMKTRSGGRYDNGEALSSGPALDAVWGKVGGRYDHFDPQSSTADYDYDLSSFEMRAGLDGVFLDSADGALIGGFTAHYQAGEAKIASRYGDSKIRPDGYGFGGTLTWFGANGFYADAQAALTWYTSELKADDLPLSPEDSDAFGYALSMEIGQAYGLGGGLALTPQAQISFANVSIESFTGAYSDNVAFSDGQSLLGRIGLAIDKETTWQDVNGQIRAANVYGIANLYYEFLGETTARVVNLYDFTTDPDDFTGEIGFGGSLDWQAGKLSYSAFAELTASTGFDTGSYGYGGNVGLKVRW